MIRSLIISRVFRMPFHFLVKLRISCSDVTYYLVIWGLRLKTLFRSSVAGSFPMKYSPVVSCARTIWQNFPNVLECHIPAHTPLLVSGILRSHDDLFYSIPMVWKKHLHPETNSNNCLITSLNQMTTSWQSFHQMSPCLGSGHYLWVGAGGNPKIAHTQHSPSKAVHSNFAS